MISKLQKMHVQHLSKQHQHLTALKISTQKSKLSQSWLMKLTPKEKNNLSTNQKKKTHIFKQSVKRVLKKKKIEEAELS